MSFGYSDQRIALFFHYHLGKGMKPEQAYELSRQRYKGLSEERLHNILNATIAARQRMPEPKRSTPETRAANKSKLEDQLDAYRGLHSE